ncbi:MAG: hypothetical protein MMC33_004091 [Icmadophila ericetorum]|nr:hypothetical protein [Icmadophila ericetorum]
MAASSKVVFSYDKESSAATESSTTDPSSIEPPTEATPSTTTQTEPTSQSKFTNEPEQWVELNLSESPKTYNKTALSEEIFAVGEELDDDDDNDDDDWAPNGPPTTLPRTRALFPPHGDGSLITIPVLQEVDSSSPSVTTSTEPSIHTLAAQRTPFRRATSSSDTFSVETVIPASEVPAASKAIAHARTHAHAQGPWSPTLHEETLALDEPDAKNLWSQILEQFPEVHRHLPGKEVEMQPLPSGHSVRAETTFSTFVKPVAKFPRPTLARAASIASIKSVVARLSVARQPPTMPSLMTMHAADVIGEGRSAVDSRPWEESASPERRRVENNSKSRVGSWLPWGSCWGLW